jgi:hypothetical protein
MKYGIKFRKAVHHEGEFMITRAGAYHSGFNFGYNIAEAVNFALPRWLTLKNVGTCKCVNDSVRINMPVFLNNLEQDPKKLKRRDLKLVNK